MPQLVQREIANAPAPVSGKAQKTGIYEIGQEDAVTGFDFWADFIDGVPGIIADGEGIARIGRKTHARGRFETAIRKPFLERGSDVSNRVILWQIKLDGDSLPIGVGVLRNLVAGNIASQDGDWIETHIMEAWTEAPFEHRRQPSHKRLLHLL